MSYAGETDIRYRLVKSSDTKRDSYHAVMKHDALTARETLEEICEATRLPRHTLESVVGGVLDTMIRGTLADGRTRRFGDWFERRLTCVTHLYVHEDEEQKIIEHDDEHILVKWFGERRKERITSPDAMFFFCPWTRDNRPYRNAPMRGSSSHVRIIL